MAALSVSKLLMLDALVPGLGWVRFKVVWQFGFAPSPQRGISANLKYPIVLPFTSSLIDEVPWI